MTPSIPQARSPQTLELSKHGTKRAPYHSPDSYKKEVPKVVVELNDDNHLKDLPVLLKLPSTGSAQAALLLH